MPRNLEGVSNREGIDVSHQREREVLNEVVRLAELAPMRCESGRREILFGSRAVSGRAREAKDN
jgi:hypothetical protein